MHTHSVVEIGLVTGEVWVDGILLVVVRDGVVGKVSVDGTGVIKEVLIVVNVVLSCVNWGVVIMDVEV